MLIHEAEELGKNPLVGKQQVMNMRNFQVLRAFAGICKIFAGVFVGRFCRKSNVVVVIVVFAFHCAFRIHLR